MLYMKELKISYSKILPVKGYHAITLFDHMIIRNEFKNIPVKKSYINHELIHAAQARDFGIGFCGYFILNMIKYACKNLIERRVFTMDIKAKIDEIVAKIKSDPAMMDNFQKDPVKTVEGIAGVDLPDDQINPVIEGIKAKLAGGALSGITDKITGLFNK